MARRRLNTKVFLFLMIGVVVCSIAVLAASRLMRGGKDPRVLEAEGDKAFAAGEYEQARLAFHTAATIESGNPNLKVKLGDTLIKLTRDDVVNLGLAWQAWEGALANDPNHKPALERLLASRWEQVERGGGSDVFADIRRRSEQLAMADPSHPKAKIWQHMATVRQSLGTLPVSDDELNKSIEALKALAEANPADAEVPFYLAQLKTKKASDLLASQAPREALLACDEALGIMEAALKGQEENPQMQYRAARIFWLLDKIDSRSAERKYLARAGSSILAAHKTIKRGDDNFDEITILGAEQLSRDGKPEEANAVRQKYYTENPDNQQARLVWASVLASKKETRDDAIALLAKEVPLPKDAVGVGVIRHRDQQFATLYELIRLRASDAANEPDEQKRKQKFAQVDTDTDQLRRLAANPRATYVLALEGQVLLAKNQPIEAVKAMEEAYAGMAGGAKDWEMVYRLALAYQTVHQPGRARQLCEEIVNSGTGHVLPARVLLSDLLLQENRVAEAVDQIKLIEAKVPDHPELNRLRNVVLLRTKRYGEVFDKMAEGTNAERWNKLRLAVASSNVDEQVRLLQAILATDPGDVAAVRTLAAIHRTNKMNDRAIAVVNAGLKHKPDDPSLRLFKAELEGVAPDELRKRTIAEIEAMVKDPLERSMRLYELEKMSGNRDAAMEHLRQAAKLGGNNLRVLDLLFKEAVDRRQFAEARTYLPKLIELNADQVGGRLYRHRLALSEQNYGDAERIGLDLVTNYAEFAQSWMAIGEAQEALGKWNEAARSFAQVLARQPMHYQATRALIDTYYNSGRTDEAKARLKEMRTNFPDDQTVRELYLNHLANFGEPQLAIPEREKLLESQSEDPWAYLALAATYFKNAQRLSADNKLDDSRAEIDKAFQILSRGQRKFPDDIRFYSQVAEVRQYNGQIEQAEQVLKDFARRENMKQAPAKIRPDPWIALSEFYSRIGKPDQAVEAMTEALVRSENNLEVRLRLVAAQVQAKKFAEAESTLDAVRSNPDPRIARQNLELLIAQGKLPEAEAAIRQSLKLRDGADLRNLMASVMIDTGRSDEAVGELNRALALDPKNEPARYLRALAYAKKSPPDLETAINELVDLKRSAPRSMQARLLLAELYEKTGRRNNAIQDLAEAMTIAPGNRDVRLALVRLYRSERPPKTKQAYDLIAAAGNDPVLKMDPIWPREAAYLFMQQRMYQQSVIYMTRAVQLAPGNIEYRRELVDMLLQINDLAGSLIQLDKLLAEGIDTWWVRYQRGLATGRQITSRMLADAAKHPAVAAKVSELRNKSMEEFDRAIKLLDAAGDIERVASVLRTLGETLGNDHALARVAPRTANDPDNRWRLLAIGLKRAHGDHAGAIADAERMLADPANGPSDADRRGPLLRALADTYQNQPTPDFTKARRYYEELLALVPNDLASLNNVAYLLAESLQPPEPLAAKTYSERAYDLTRTSSNPNALIMDTHGWVLVLCGGADGDRGRRILQKVTDENPHFIEGRYHLAEALLRVEPVAPSQAEKEFAECLRLMDEEEKIGGKVDQKLRSRVQTGLANARDAMAK